MYNLHTDDIMNLHEYDFSLNASQIAFYEKMAVQERKCKIIHYDNKTNAHNKKWKGGKKKKKIHINPLVKERNLSCAFPLLLMVGIDNFF